MPRGQVQGSIIIEVPVEKKAQRCSSPLANHQRIMSATNRVAFDSELDEALLSTTATDSRPLSHGLRSKIIASLWSQSSGQQVEDYSVYFQFFVTECEAWRLSGSAVAIQTYRDFLELVQHLRNHRQEPRASAKVLSFFPPRPPPGVQAQNVWVKLTANESPLPLVSRYAYCHKDSVRNAIDLAICLYLMLSPGSPGMISFPGRSTLRWGETESLDEFIGQSVPMSVPNLASVWPQSLNLYNLDRVGGFDVVWTNHLADHLYLNEDLGTISIYHHARILQSHKKEDSTKYV